MRGTSFDNIINPLTLEAVKAVAAQYTAQNLIDQRSAVKDKLDSMLSTRLAHYCIVVDNVSLTQFKFSDEFNNAIEAKVTQEQASLQAKAKLQQVNWEAAATRAQASADAYALRVKRVSLTPILVQQEWVEKWDGHLPTITGSGGTYTQLPSNFFNSDDSSPAPNPSK